MEQNEFEYEPQKKSTGGKGCMISIIIVLLVLVGLLLTVIALFFGANGGGFGKWETSRISFGDRVGQLVQDSLDIGYSYIDAEDYTVGAAEIETRNVNRVVIDWVSGSVTVEAYDGDTVSVSEPEQREQADRLRWRQKGDTLTVRYCAAMNLNVSESKDLVVKLPKELAENLRYLQIDTVSAETHVSGVTAGELQFDSTSGSMHAEGSFGILDADTTSGALEFNGAANAVELDTVSGDYSMHFAETPDELSFDSTSGDLTIMLPAKRGFEVEHDSVSGDFKCDFALVLNDDPYYEGEKSGKRAELEFDTVSGDVWIMNAQWA